MMKLRIVIILLNVFCVTVLAQTKHALLVGISDYQCVNKYSGWNNINGKNDTKLLLPVLKNADFNVVTLNDKQATKDNIINQLASMSKSIRKGDVVYLHFSCHGQPFEDLNGDEDDGWDEAIVPVDAFIEYTKGKYEGQKHILDDELRTHVDNLRKAIGTNGVLYVVIDACHAGKASQGQDDEIIRGTKAGFSRSGKYYKPQKLEKGNYYQIGSSPNMSKVIFLEACRSYQVNKEIKVGDKYYGALSYYIYEVLKKQTLGKDIRWIYKVRDLMQQDVRLSNQNMVIEESK